MELILIRRWLDVDRTIGELHIDGTFFCYTCEDTYRGDDMAVVKVFGKTAIPCGRYAVEITWSDKFKTQMPLVKSVPGFTGIRMHPGNDEKDTDGCILVGMTRDEHRILNSRLAYEKLKARIATAEHKGEPVMLTVKVAPDADRQVC